MKNLSIKLLTVAGIALFVVIAVVIVKNTSTLIAVVPNQEIKEGTVLTQEMLKEIQIPTRTPKGYITDKRSLVGQKLRITVNQDQLLYINDIMSSWEELIDDIDVPDNYVITSIVLPDSRAVGGLITSGNSVDILGIPNSSYRSYSNEMLKEHLGKIAEFDSYGTEEGINAFWVLSNVKILECNSALSVTEGSAIPQITGMANQEEKGSNYIVALSYADYQKLRIAEVYFDLWMSLCPANNEENDPLFEEMRQRTIKEMVDSQNQKEDYLLRDDTLDEGDDSIGEESDDSDIEINVQESENGENLPLPLPEVNDLIDKALN